MKEIIAWLNDALAGKDLSHEMTHYRIQNREICATDGRITAAYPWPTDDAFLVPGHEFQTLLARMPIEPQFSVRDDHIILKAKRFRGEIRTLPLTEWNYPGVESAVWQPLPQALPALLRALRPFISDNAVQPWATCVALEGGWVYATNNIALAGAPCKGLEDAKALLPSWAVDFVLDRLNGLRQWAWTDNYVAFKWDNGAWMRSQLVIGQFPERAAELIRSALHQRPTQVITPAFREAFNHVAELAEDTITLYADRIESNFKRAVIECEVDCETPEESNCSVWGAKYLLPALQVADKWSPSSWPQPAVFKGKLLSGYVVGRRPA